MSREHCRESQTKVNSIEDPKFLSEYYAVNRMGRKTIAWICPLCQEYQQMPLLEHRKNCWTCPRCQKNQRGFKNDHKKKCFICQRCNKLQECSAKEHNSQCSLKKKQCWLCSRYLPPTDLTAHMKDCRSRCYNCRRCNKMKIPVEKKAEHLAQCPTRVYCKQCQYGF